MKKYTLFLLLALATLFNSSNFTAQCFPNGHALDFDGVDDYVSSSASGFTPTYITMEAWVYRTNSQHGTVVAKYEHNSSNAGATLGINFDPINSNAALEGAVYFSVGRSWDRWKGTVSAANSVPLNTWTHIAGTFDGTNVRVYVNGVLSNSVVWESWQQTSYPSVTATTPAGIIYPANVPFTIGKRLDSGSSYIFKGKIDEVRVWSVARSQTELSANMNASLTTGTGLIASYNFNAGLVGQTNSGVTNVLDLSSGARHAIANNFSLSGTSSNWVQSAGGPGISTITNATTCGAATASMGATATGGTINWYSPLTGGSSLATGISYSPASVSATTTYYVDVSSTTCTSSPRTPVVVTYSNAAAITGNSTVTAGETLTLLGSETPNSSSPWSVSNTNAIVSNGGVVTGLLAGNTTITYTTSDNCSTTKEVTVLQAPFPVITSFSPSTQDVGGTITINGSNFNSTLANNVVFFGGVKATVVSGSTSQLVVTVPSGALHAPITLVSDGYVAHSGNKFSPKNSAIASQTFSSTSFSTIAANVSLVSNGTQNVAGLGSCVGTLFATADFNGDGKLDIVKGGSNGTIEVALNNSSIGNISFAAAIPFAVSAGSVSINELEVADIDADGDLDIIVANGESTNGVRILFNSSSNGNLDFTQSHYSINSVDRVKIADFNLDGRLDIAVAKNFAGGIKIYLNNSTIGQSVTYNTSSPISISTGSVTKFDIGDVNLDGKMDIVVNGSTASYRLLLNTSNIVSLSFTSIAVTNTDGASTASVEFLDVDQNGTMDILTQGTCNSFINLSINNFSTGTFTSASLSTTSLTNGSWDCGGSISSADFTGDGKVDIANAGYSNTGVILRKNVFSTGSYGTSSFSSISRTANNHVQAIKFADLDGDNKMDLLVSPRSTSSIQVFRNRLGDPETITVTGTSNALKSCSGFAGVSDSVILSGYYLTTNVTVTAPSGFEISTTLSSGYSSTLSIPFAQVNDANKKIYVRIASNAVGTPSGSITFTSTNAASQSTFVSGIVNPIPTISGNLSIVSGTTQLSGSGVAATTNPWVSSTPLVATISASGLVSAVEAGSSTITYTDNNGCSQTATLLITMPIITVSSSIVSSFQACNGFSTSPSALISLSGANMTEGILITPPVGFEVSTTVDFQIIGTNTSPLLVGSGSSISSQLYVRISSSASVGSYSDYINLTSAGANTKTIAVSGTVYAVPSVTSTTAPTRCGNGVVSYVAAASSGAGVKWYAASIGGASLATNTTYAPTISSTTSYFAEAFNSTLTTCVSAARSEVIGVVKPLPTGSITGNTTDACINSTVSLVYSGTATSVQWQSSNNNSTWGNITSATNTTYSPSINGSQYYRVNMTLDGCTAATATTVYQTANQALDFDGTNDHVVLASPYNYATTASYTIEAWINLDIIASGGIYPIFSHQNGSTTTTGYRFYVDGSGFLRFGRGGVVSSDATSATSLIAGRWYHVAVTYDGTQIKLYIDGVQSGTAVNSASISPVSATTYIGRWNASYFNGKIDEVKLWGIDRSSNVLSTTTSGLVYYQDFNQGWVSGGLNTGNTTISNASGLTANNGILTNFGSTPVTGAVINGLNSNFVNGYGVSITTQPSAASALYCTSSTATALTSAAIGKSVSYQWYSNTSASTSGSTAISGATSSTYTPSTATNGTLYYYVTASSCTNSLNSVITGAIQVSPSIAGTISGSTTVCPGTGTVLTLTGSVGNIQWSSSPSLTGSYTAISGATSATLSTGNLSSTTYYKAEVTSGTCPSSTTAAYTVSTTPLGNIGSISGPSPVTLGGTATYSVTSVTNATSYVWNLPAGMTLTSSANDGASITVSIANNFAGGTLTAQAVGCTNSSIVSKVVNAPSAATLSITTTTSGAPVFCGGTTASFSTTTTSTNNTATYLWTLPTGVSVASGSSLTGSAINVVFAANYNGGTISVTRVSSTESLIAYYTVGAIATPGVITGPSTLCGASSGTYSIASVSGANSYEWSLPTGMTGTSTSTSINVSWTGSITGNVQVRAVKNSCGTSAWRTLSVASVATPGAITGPTTTCGANSNTISASGTNTTTLNTATYSISAVTGATGYTWTVPTGMAITSGQGTTSINVTITPSSFTSGSVTVVATTSTCTSAVRSLSISSANSTIVGPTDLCGLSQATYSINAPSGATVTWTLADWMSLASGQTLTSNPITVNIGAAPSQQNITASYSTSCGTVTGSRFVGCNSFTQLENTYCGGSVSNATQVVLAQYIGSGSYKFEVSGGSIGSTASILTQSWNGFTFAQIPGILPGTYSVKVSFKPTGSGTFGSFGSTCSVTLGSDVPSTEVISSQCGSTVSTLTTVVSATYKGAGTYQFVISGNGLGSPVTLTQSWNGFTFAQIPGVLPGSYNVKVNYKPTGYSTYGPDGQVCSVTLGSDVPSTEVISSQCGSTVSTLTTVVSATYKGAGTYQFVISGNGLGSPVTLTQSWNGFTFAQIPGVLPGSYNVKVNYKPTGYSTYGPDGQVCSVTLGSDVPSTEVISSQCGSTVSTLTTVVSATYKGAGTYQFVISGNGLGSPVTLTQSWNGFTFAQIPGVLPGSYNVKVNYKPTGYSTYGPDGQVCSVTLGSDVPSTEVISSQCGSTVSTLTTVVSATYKGAGTYQFVISGNGLGSPVTLTQSWNGFTFAQIPGVLPGSYNVKVNYKPTGYSTYGPDGQVCSVTLGSDVPSTEIEACGSSGINGMSTIVFATYKGAGTYEFVINHASFTSPVTLTQSWNGFMFSQVPGAIYGGYSITVRYKPTGYSSFGQPTTCNSLELLDPGALVTQGPQLHEEATEGIQTEEDATETAATLTETPATTTWTATATSNPFATSFQIKLNGAEGINSDASFTAQLTDMSGKVYSQGTLSKEQLEAESFGEQLAPGMYLMTLHQGEELRVIRVVKR